MINRKNKTYTDEFKREAVALVTDQGYAVTEAAASLCITTKLIYNWKAKKLIFQYLGLYKNTFPYTLQCIIMQHKFYYVIRISPQTIVLTWIFHRAQYKRALLNILDLLPHLFY